MSWSAQNLEGFGLCQLSGAKSVELHDPLARDVGLLLDGSTQSSGTFFFLQAIAIAAGSPELEM